MGFVLSIPAQLNMCDLMTGVNPSAGVCEGGSIHLWTNDYVPTPGSSPGNFDEPTWADYAPLPITGMSVASLSGDGHAFSQSDLVTFGPWDADHTIFGYYILLSDGSFLGAERSPVAPVLIMAGDTLPFVLTYRDSPE